MGLQRTLRGTADKLLEDWVPPKWQPELPDRKRLGGEEGKKLRKKLTKKANDAKKNKRKVNKGVPLFAARTLNATGQSRVTLSLRQENLRAACRLRQKERGAEIRPKQFSPCAR